MKRHSAVLFAGALLALAVGAMPGSDVGASMADETASAQDELRIYGEFGLAVHTEGDSVTVRWLTPTLTAGFLAVEAADGARRTFVTPEWGAHSVTFAAPPDGPFLLTYGAEDEPDSLHHTRIHPDRGSHDAPIRVSGVDSLFVIADVHGEYDRMIAVLRNAGVIDSDLRWSGGTSHLVSLGDMMSRGEDVAAVLWFLYRLEREAEEAGGRVHVLLGNHEIMVMLGDLRYVRYKEAWIAESHRLDYDRLYDPRRSVLGRWLAGKPAMLQVDDVLLSHAGVSPAYLDYTPESHRDSLAAFIAEDLFYFWADTTHFHDVDEESFYRRVDFFWDSTSVFWYREYARSDTLDSELSAVLKHYGASVQVVGHTPVEGIREAYDGRLVMTNTLPFADEVLLMERTAAGWDRHRIGSTGPPATLLRGHPEVPTPDAPDSAGVGGGHRH